MTNKQNTSLIVGDGQDLRLSLQKQYTKIVNNFLGNEQEAKKFLSNILAEMQRNEKLRECDSFSLVDSFIKMSEFRFMPSSVMGEAYVIPYKVKGKMTANFQPGYQGILTLLFRAGVKNITAELVRKNDKRSKINGKIVHEIDMDKSDDERGEIIGVLAQAEFNGGLTQKYMHIKDIIKHGKKYSKTYGKYQSTWETDPEWMYKKTVLIQLAKLLPKNEEFKKALDYDFQGDSVINDRLEKAKSSGKLLTMGKNLKNNNEKETNKNENKTSENSKG